MSGVPDFYASLGVERSASRESIIAAFRRLAMKWHPDRHVNATDKVEAERQFKIIKTAYEILSDDSRRANYDHEHTVMQSAQWGREYYERNADDADHRQRESVRRGADVDKEVAVTIAEAVNGTRISFEETLVEPCAQCAGERGEFVACGRCNGFLKYSRKNICPVCRNSGKEWVNCGPCNGAGTVTRRRKITVRAPAGMVDGSVLTVKERGKPSEHGGLHGDLHITIRLESAPGWKRKGLDLSSTLKLPYSIALLGGTIDVPLPTGKTVQVEIPARTPSGKKIRLAGEGLFDAANEQRGDIVLTATIALPSARRKLTPEMEALLRQIDGIES